MLGRFRKSWGNSLEVVGNFPLGNRIGRRMAAAMRNADVHFSNTRLLENFAGTSAECDCGCPAREIADLNISPTDAAPPTRAERFEYGFLGSPATCIVLSRRFLGGAISNFVRGVHATDKQLAVTIDHLRDPQTFDDIGADANDLQCHG